MRICWLCRVRGIVINIYFILGILISVKCFDVCFFVEGNNGSIRLMEIIDEWKEDLWSFFFLCWGVYCCEDEICCCLRLVLGVLELWLIWCDWLRVYDVYGIRGRRLEWFDEEVEGWDKILGCRDGLFYRVWGKEVVDDCYMLFFDLWLYWCMLNIIWRGCWMNMRCLNMIRWC